MRIKKLNQRWLDNSRFPALEAVCLLFGIAFVLIHFSLWPVEKSYVAVLNNQMKKLQTKTTWSFAFSCPSVSLLAFPPPFILSSDWLPMEITLDLVSQHSIEIGWMAALRWRRHTSNKKIDVVDWLVLGLQIIYIFLGDASLLQIFEAVYYRRNFTKRVSICCVWRHTTFTSSLNVQGYEVGQVTRASKQVFLYRLGKEPRERIRPTQGSIVCKSISCINK